MLCSVDTFFFGTCRAYTFKQREHRLVIRNGCRGAEGGINLMSLFLIGFAYWLFTMTWGIGLGLVALCAAVPAMFGLCFMGRPKSVMIVDKRSRTVVLIKRGCCTCNDKRIPFEGIQKAALFELTRTKGQRRNRSQVLVYALGLKMKDGTDTLLGSYTNDDPASKERDILLINELLEADLNGGPGSANANAHHAQPPVLADPVVVVDPIPLATAVPAVETHESRRESQGYRTSI